MRSLTRQKIILILSAAVVLAGLYWFYSHAYIEIVVENATDGSELTYSYLNQSNEKLVSSSTTSTSFKKLVRRGSYELLVNQSDSSSFSITNVGGFLSKTTVRAKLTQEKKRTFVGNNPGPCMQVLEGVLYSFSCDSRINDVQLHVPATERLPTHVEKISTVVEGVIEGSTRTSEGSLVLVRAPSSSEDQAPHTIYRLSSGFDPQSGISLDDLRSEARYSLKAFRDGFLAFDEQNSHALYYSSTSATPSEVVIEKPADQKMSPYYFHPQDNSLLVAYTEDAKVDLDDPDTARLRSELVVHGNDAVRRIELNKRYSSILLCGSNKLCGLLDGTMDVYDISANKPKLMFSLSSVIAMEPGAQGIMVVRNKEVLQLNLEERSGFADYSFGEYEYCGHQTENSALVVCLTDSDKRRFALIIDQNANNTDSIDKKVVELGKLAEVDSISIYGNLIFVSPNYGEAIFNPTLNSYTHNPEIKPGVDAAIGQKISELGIDTSIYKVINTLN